MRIFLIVLMASMLCAATSLADYNPATGEDELILVDEAKEVRIGNSIARNVEEQFGLLNDDDMQERVDRVGQRIAKVCDRPELVYSFRVLEGEKLEEEARYNAFALPGGYVYIFKEMVNDMRSDDELGAILAHEVGHIVARHSVKKLQSSIGIVGLNILGAISRTDKRTQIESTIAIAELTMAYHRQAEFEADKLSIIYLREAGFDPKAAVAIIDRMLDKQLNAKIKRYRYFRTHPYITERRAMLNKEIEGKFAFEDYINAPSEKESTFW